MADVTATLNYHLEESKGGIDHFYAGTVGQKRRPVVPVSTHIRDMRGHEQDFSLDVQGFQRVERSCPAEWFEDDAVIRKDYYEDCQKVVKEATGASTVHILSHIVRKQDWKDQIREEEGLDDLARTSGAGSAEFVHIDQSYNGAYTRISQLFPSAKTSLSTKRWAIINLWRPLAPITRSPLAVCDARSTPDSDLWEVEARFPTTSQTPGNLPKNSQDPYGGRTNFGTWGVLPPKAGEHEWWYWSEMRPEEALLLKIFDSEEREGLARRCAHTAFRSERDWGDVRQSVEVRCFVLWE